MAYDHMDNSRKMEIGECEDCDKGDFRSELVIIINRYSMGNYSGTPDFILADFLVNCLDSFGSAVTAHKWHGNSLNSSPSSPEPPE